MAVLDIQMPEAGRIEVARWVRGNHPQVGVLVLTAYDDTPCVIAVLNAGANGYVLKTAAPPQSIQAVRDVHEGKSALDSAITRKLMGHITGQHAKPQYGPLTERETKVLEYTPQGHMNKAIGLKLGISDRTAQGHLAKIYSKLGVNNRTEAVMRDIALGWLDADVADG